MLANTPAPPYYAVIFSSESTAAIDSTEYATMAAQMEAMAMEQPGYLGFEAARDGIGIAVSYWSDIDSIRNWKRNVAHQQAQRLGREAWYQQYRVRIARVERDYDFSGNED